MDEAWQESNLVKILDMIKEQIYLQHQIREELEKFHPNKSKTSPKQLVALRECLGTSKPHLSSTTMHLHKIKTWVTMIKDQTCVLSMNLL